MGLTFKNRIALHYMLATAALVAAAYLVVFLVVRQQVYADLDASLHYEAALHLREVTMHEQHIHFSHKGEWEEREHRVVQVDPVFIQVSDPQGRLLDRSPNLKADQLVFNPRNTRVLLNSTLRGKAIRQVQVPLRRTSGGPPVGYLLAALSAEAAQHVLSSLRNVLLLSFPVVLLALFGIARWLAGRSIAPMVSITATTNHITRSNLAERIALPPRPDELHQLASAINGLLQRIEQAVEREKQFTADASHELRTPLAVLKGTLEVLIRKPRTPEEYVRNIQLGVREIDRLTHLVEQLLLMARFEDTARPLLRQEVSVVRVVHDILYRLAPDLQANRLRVEVQDQDSAPITADPYLVELILDNLLSNAVKYSPAGATITVQLNPTAKHLRCAITDRGIGIRPEELAHIFNPLYRSDALAHKQIQGTGLGLSIAAKASALLGSELSVQSKPGEGSTFTLLLPV